MAEVTLILAKTKDGLQLEAVAQVPEADLLPDALGFETS